MTKTITIGEIREKIASQIAAASKRKLELLSRTKADEEFVAAKAEFEKGLAESAKLAAGLDKEIKDSESISKEVQDLRARLANATPEALGPWTDELAAALKRLEASNIAVKAASDAMPASIEALKQKQNDIATRMAAARGTLSMHDRIDSEILHLQSLLKPLSGASYSKGGLLDLSASKRLALGPVTDTGNMYIAKAEIGARVDGEFTEWIGVVLAPSGDVIDWMPLRAT